MTHRGGRVALERKLISAILYAEPYLCLDCLTVKFRVRTEDGAHLIELIHRPTCPCRRTPWSKRAGTDYIRGLLIAAGMHLADYNDIEPVHK